METQPQHLDSPPLDAGLQHPSRPRPLANRDFKLLWSGESISLLGDQFYLIALPWLVFQMTNSSLAFGSVLLVSGIPRALLMLLGGVVTDRISPRRVMIISNLLRFGITVLLLLLIAGQLVALWMLFVIAFCFGLVDAFFYPAYRAMIPLIVHEDDLQASNALMQGTSQIISIVGPGTAGVIVAQLGMALSFAFDAFTFLFSALMVWLMRPVALTRRVEQAAGNVRHHVLAEIREMLIYLRSDHLLAILIGVVAAINLFFTGPLVVGSATLSRMRFLEGSTAYGAMLSMFSIGILVGTVAAGLLKLKRPGVISLLLVGTQGIFMIGIGFAQSLVMVCVLWLVIGCTAGFGSINFITLTQKRINRAMMGRFMSVIALAEVGLAPISNALAGVIADLDVTALFVGAGLLLTATTLLALTKEIGRQYIAVC